MAKLNGNAKWLAALVAFGVAVATVALAHANAVNRIEILERDNRRFEVSLDRLFDKIDRIGKVQLIMARHLKIDTKVD